MGAGAYFSIQFGRRDTERLRQSAALSFAVIALVTLVMNALMFAGINGILQFLKVPSEVIGLMKSYLLVIFSGLIATFLYNFFACLLRALGNSAAPLWFLAVSALLNVGLDLLFVLVFRWGVAGAAGATVLAQYVSGVGIAVYFWRTCPELRPRRQDFRWDGGVMREIGGLSLLTCFQQSIMNFGILMVQGLLNSFGAATMTASAAAVTAAAALALLIGRGRLRLSGVIVPLQRSQSRRQAVLRGQGRGLLLFAQLRQLGQGGLHIALGALAFSVADHT